MRHRRRGSRGPDISTVWRSCMSGARQVLFPDVSGSGDVSFRPSGPRTSDPRITKYTFHIEANRPCSETRCQYRFLTGALP